MAKETPKSGFGFDFGDAIRALKAGQRVARAGWNGKGMWIMLGEVDAIASGDPSDTRVRYREASHFGATQIRPCIVMFDAQGMLVPGWFASQTDMLAEDWEVVS